MINTVRKSIDSVGFTHIQYKGEVAPLTKDEIALLDKEYVRVKGFDGMFVTPVFSTITYVKDYKGLMSFFEIGICKRYVKDMDVETHDTQVGIIKCIEPHITLKLNTEHRYIEKFKSVFLGKGGKTISKLSKDLKCTITLE